MPAELFKLPNGVYGCPDCADQGGFYIETQQDGQTRFWYIDAAKQNVPTACAQAIKTVGEAMDKLQ